MPLFRNIRAWEYALLHGANDPLLPPDIRLYERLTDQQIRNFHRIVMESVEIVRSTSNGVTKKNRLKLARENLRRLQELKNFAGRDGKKLILEAERAVKGIQ